MNDKHFERWTERSRKVAELALREALSYGHNYIGPEHLLLALIRHEENVAARVLRDHGTEDEWRKRVSEAVQVCPCCGQRRAA